MNSRQESAVLVAGTVAAVIGGGLVYSGFIWQRSKARQATCISHYKQVGLASMQYIRDYDEYTPPAANWTKVLWPYSKSTAIFQCPERGALPQGVAYHREAVIVAISSWLDARTAIWYFDSSGNKSNFSDSGASFARPTRHPGGNTVGYADGHVKMGFTPDFKAGYGPVFRKRAEESDRASAKFWERQRLRQMTGQRTSHKLPEKP